MAYKPYLEAARSPGWDHVPLSPPPPTYSFVETQRETEKRTARKRISSSVYGGSDEYGGQADRMSILSFISYYEYFRPEDKKEKPRDSYYTSYYA